MNDAGSRTFWSVPASLGTPNHITRALSERNAQTLFKLQRVSSACTTSTVSQEWLARGNLLLERPGGVEPLDRLGHRPVEVVDEPLNPLTQVFERLETGPAQELATKRGVTSALISLSHTDHYAMACVFLEG